MKFVLGNRAESQNCKKFAVTAGADSIREQCRWCCFTTDLWTTVMNEHKQNYRDPFLKNVFENPCTQMKFALQFQYNVSVTELKF